MRIRLVCRSGEVIRGYDFIVNSVWPEVVSNIEARTPSMFAPGNPNLFHQVRACCDRFAYIYILKPQAHDGREARKIGKNRFISRRFARDTERDMYSYGKSLHASRLRCICSINDLLVVFFMCYGCCHQPVSQT